MSRSPYKIKLKTKNSLSHGLDIKKRLFPNMSLTHSLSLPAKYYATIWQREKKKKKKPTGHQFRIEYAIHTLFSPVLQQILKNETKFMENCQSYLQ